MNTRATSATRCTKTSRGTAGAKSKLTPRKERTAKTCNYWVRKMSYAAALSNKLDQRDVTQSKKAIAREEAPGKDNDGASLLDEHLGKLGVLSKAGPTEIAKSSWVEIVDAYELMRILEVKPSLECLLALVNKTFDDKMRHVKSGSEPGDLAVVVLLYQRPHENFNICEPRLAPLLDFLKVRVAVNTFMKVFREYFFPLVRNTGKEVGELEMLALRSKQLLMRLEIPDDIDYIPKRTLGLISKVLTGLRALEYCQNPVITEAGVSAQIQDVLLVYKASENTAAEKSFLTELGMAIKASAGLNKNFFQIAGPWKDIENASAMFSNQLVNLKQALDAQEISCK